MGLGINVYRDAKERGDCSNNGVSARFARLWVANVSGPFDFRPDAEAAVILESHVPGCLRLVPAELKDGSWVKTNDWVMFGGNYGATSDSRFGEKCRQLLAREGRRGEFYGAVAIHDRVEP